MTSSWSTEILALEPSHEANPAASSDDGAALGNVSLLPFLTDVVDYSRPGILAVGASLLLILAVLVGLILLRRSSKALSLAQKKPVQDMTVEEEVRSLLKWADQGQLHNVSAALRRILRKLADNEATAGQGN